MTDLSGLGIPTLDWGEVFHMGIRVADLAAAQAGAEPRRSGCAGPRPLRSR